jgi:DNA-binding transcriptional ArsR family regulator
VKQGTKGAKRYTYEVQLDRKGRVIRTLELLSATKVIKTIYPGSIEELGMSLLMPSGQRQGSLMHAMFESNVTTQYRGAKLIEVSIRGKDRQGKERRVKVSIEPTKTRRLHELVMSRIMQKLRENDVRTQYSIEILRAAKAAGPLKYPLSYERFRTLEPLVGVEIVITIYR